MIVFLPGLVFLGITLLLCMEMEKPHRKHLIAAFFAFLSVPGMGLAFSKVPIVANAGSMILLACLIGTFVSLCLPPHGKDQKRGVAIRTLALITVLVSWLVFLHLKMMSGVD